MSERSAFPRPAQQALDAFATVFPDTGSYQGPLSVVWAPGRVNLIGEHTDYNAGYVLPLAEVTLRSLRK